MGYDSTLFYDTYEYYAKYRPNVPEEVVQIIVEQFDIKPVDRILDIGCGTCQIAIAMDGKCDEMVCLDSDLEMLKQAKREIERMNLKQKIILVNCYAEDLIKRKSGLKIFKLATICRAFHWMDQNKVLTDLDSLISEDGGIAILVMEVFGLAKKNGNMQLKRLFKNIWARNVMLGKEPSKNHLNHGRI